MPTLTPSPRLQPYIRQFVISESDMGGDYPVFPSTGMVMGFQYRGRLRLLEEGEARELAVAGITGMADRARQFSHQGAIGTVLVYFTETGLSYFTRCPANELFNCSVSLEHIFPPASVRATEEQLALARTDRQRIFIVEKFLLGHLSERHADHLVMEAVKRIYAAKGQIRIGELHRQLLVSQSPFEKRFRKLVGATPKKFASVVRFNTVMKQVATGRSLMDICYENNFFDPAHFSKEFKQFTGQSPEYFRKEG